MSNKWDLVLQGGQSNLRFDITFASKTLLNLISIVLLKVVFNLNFFVVVLLVPIVVIFIMGLDSCAMV